MNRQIEFRGKNLENEWVYGYFYIHEPPLVCFENERDDSKRKYYIIQTGFADWNMDRPKVWHEVNKETVGQFTGLLDKNNKKIFEDDILKTNEANWIAKVIYHYDGFMLTGLDNAGFSCSPDYDKCEIIGNTIDGVKNVDN